ncbi:MAG TPA: phosphate acyltransferase, partial [Thermomicrobiales bacterium]|nr:phosphate acyltransferase [Thermomicrobiales bacterium]
MAQNIYITSAEGNTGKSTIALGMLETLKRSGKTIGVFRPISRSTTGEDYILDLLLAHLWMPDRAPDLIGVSYDDVHADPDAALARIVARYKAIEPEFDVVLILGSDYTDVSTPTELSYNARIAANLGAPVLLVLGGRSQNELIPSNAQALTGAARSPEEIAQAAEIALAELHDEHAQLIAVIANRVDPEQLAATTGAIFATVSPSGQIPVWSLPEDAVLIAPTLRALMETLDASLYRGDAGLLDREAMSVVVAAMSMENVLVRLTPDSAVVAPGDRSEVLLSLLMAHTSGTFPSLSGIILNGGFDVSPTIERLIEGIGVDLPILRTNLNTFETAYRVSRTRGRFGADSQRKYDRALSIFDAHVDGKAILAVLDVVREDIVTPLMFEYQLLERARSNRKHIVLPEGDDDRILRAAGTLLERQAAALTILGDENDIRGRASRLGRDLTGACILSPFDPELRERFAQSYAQLRAHKGVTLEQAR